MNRKGKDMTSEIKFYVTTKEGAIHDCNGAILFEVGDKIINKNGEWTVQNISTVSEIVNETNIFHKFFKRYEKTTVKSNYKKNIFLKWNCNT